SPASITLSEAVVTGYSGEFIYRKALEQINENYLGKPHISKGFYRVTTQSDDQFIHLSEAVFEIYKDGDNSSKKPFKLLKMRATKDKAAAHGISIGHSPGTIISNDVATIDDAGLTSKSLFKTHEFELLGTTVYDNQEVYEVAFQQKSGNKKPGFIGTVLIDKETFAFLRFNYQINPETTQYIKIGSVATRTLMALVGLKVEYLTGKTIINYKRIGDHYFLSDVQDSSRLFFKNDRQNYQFQTDLRSDYVVTEVQLDNILPPSREDLLKNSKMIENQNIPYDQQFWDNYNIILPNSDFGAIAKSIEMRNKQFDYKYQLEHVINKYPKNKSIRIDSILTFYNRKGLFNGNALVNYENQTIFHRSYNNEVTNNQKESVFRIGSTSKTFTSMLVMLLAENQQLQLEDTVGKFLPSYRHGQITISQLLSHQSGIPNYLSNGLYTKKIYEKPFSTMELVSKFCSDDLEFSP
ncbi:MAG: serine hydrolase domain-containing protein, partial [Bacteroidota bacterium]